MLARSWLFVPGNRPERFDKACGAGADAVILDLEDAVAMADKGRARAAACEWIVWHRSLDSRTIVRINDAGSAAFAADLALLAQTGVKYAMLPKAEAVAQVAQVAEAMPSGGSVLPLIETARGVQNVEAIAEASGVERLAIGTLDHCVDLDLDLSGDERGLLYSCSRIALVSRCAGIATPIAGVTRELDDAPKLLADLAFARAQGFGAKLCIHPRQIAVIHKALLPTPDELDWARRVLAASVGAQVAVQVDGRMVDRPRAAEGPGHTRSREERVSRG